MTAPRSGWDQALAEVDQFAACEQCGTCSSACPLTGVDDFNIRRILRHVELGLGEEIAATGQPWQCTTCGRCESACPNGVAILDVVRRLRRLTDPPRTVPACRAACPGDIDVPGYLRHLAAGRPDLAYAVILDSVPFPGTLGRVCPHPCETACTRATVNQPVAICGLKRYAADHAGPAAIAPLPVATDTGKRIAIIGAGPAGLTAGFYLRRHGHAVTILEAADRPGGMMRYGIPRYRLPEPVLDREIDQLLATGIELRTGVRLGDEVTIDELRTSGFDVVLIATGLSRAKRIPLRGADHPEVRWGLDFLRDAAVGAARARGRVVVVGGGDVAVDVAMTALRCGADAATLVCLESRDEMPAHPWEIDAAVAEGVAVMAGWGPVELCAGDTGMSLALRRCCSVFDQHGRFAPEFDDTETSQVAADQLVLAIGQDADLDFAAAAGLQTASHLLSTDPQTGATAMPGVFAVGEITSGPGALIEAIADGKRLAASIDGYLGGAGSVADAATVTESPEYDGSRPLGFADRQRAVLPERSLAERGDFAEIELGLADQAAIAEAARCLSCDLECRLGKGS